jgi:hypothetical protein
LKRKTPLADRFPKRRRLSQARGTDNELQKPCQPPKSRNPKGLAEFAGFAGRAEKAAIYLLAGKKFPSAYRLASIC